ncbi:MAG: hypothetical protein ACLQGV_05845 [Bryobacteraceae bacterium]
MLKSPIFVCAVLAAGSGLAYADSDGCFCSSPSFLAYEFSFSKQPANQHKLYVVRFGEVLPASPPSIEIPDFQVHGMTCNDTGVEIFGWDREYLVNVSATAISLVSETRLPAPGKFPGDHRDPPNLAGWSPVTRGAVPKEYTFKLEARDAVYRYELRIKRLDTKNPCESTVEATLAKVGQHGETRERLLIYKGKAPMECGE